MNIQSQKNKYRPTIKNNIDASISVSINAAENNTLKNDRLLFPKVIFVFILRTG